MHPQGHQAPAAPTPPLPTIVVRGPSGSQTIISPPPTAPLTSRDIAVLKARRSELSDQLQSVDSRRSKLLSQLQATGDETARQGLEDRLSLLDKRQLQLESDIGETGRQLSSAPAGLVAVAGSPDNPFRSVKSGVLPVVGIVAVFFVLAPFARGAARRMFGDDHSRRGQSGLSADSSQRLERIEQSIDAIALEIERVSEGQRFVTKLLSESQHIPAIGAGRVPDAVRSNQ